MSIEDILSKLERIFKQAEQKRCDFNKLLKALRNYQSNIAKSGPDYQSGGIYKHDLIAMPMDYFGSGVCAHTSFHKPILTTNYFAQIWINDRFPQNDKNKRFLKLHELAKNNSHQWFKFPDSFSDSNNLNADLPAIASDVDKRVIQPLLGTTNFKPQNVNSTVKQYKKHQAINRSNYNVSEEISISDQLDNNQDRQALMKAPLIDIKMDHYCLSMLKKCQFSHVIDPKNLTKSYLD